MFLRKTKAHVFSNSRIIRTICIEWVDTQNGDYILAHAGVALTVVNRDDAEAALDDFRKLSTFNTRHHE